MSILQSILLNISSVSLPLPLWFLSPHSFCLSPSVHLAACLLNSNPFVALWPNYCNKQEFALVSLSLSLSPSNTPVTSLSLSLWLVDCCLFILMGPQAFNTLNVITIQWKSVHTRQRHLTDAAHTLPRYINIYKATNCSTAAFAVVAIVALCNALQGE